MSLRVTWDGALPTGEPMDVVMEDCTSWTPANTVLKAGRELSSWFFKRPSTQRRPSLFSLCSSPRETEFYDTNSPMDMDISKRPLSIGDLPSEVLGEIFMAYLDTPSSDDFPTSHEVARYRVSSQLYSSSSPILLGQVCPTWRAFTQSSPILWRKISVACPRPQDISLFAQWLERSGEMPLDLAFIDLGDIDTAAAREIFRLALTQSHRWNNVSFDLATDMGDLVPHQPLPSTMKLSSFDLKMAHWAESSLQSLLQLLYSSPHLRKVTYDMPSSNTALSAILQTPDHLYPSITHLEIGYIAAEELFCLLHRYTALTHLSFRTTTPPRHPASCSNPITMSKLRYLCIDHGNDIVPLFDSLCLPALSHLELPNGFASAYSPRSSTYAGWEALFGLLERSSFAETRLGSLSFKASGMDEEIIVQALASPLLDSLKSLSILSKVTDPLVVALTVRDKTDNSHTSVLLPKLETLELGNCGSSDGRLSDLIISRSGSLKYVKAVFRESHSVVRDLALRMPGVEIVF